MNNKTTISLSLLALLSMGLGLSGCGEKTDKNQAVDSSATAANQPLEQDFDQDNDPYPDEYLLEGVGGRTNNNGANKPDNKPDNKSQNKTPNKTSRAIPAQSIKQQLEAAFPNIKIEEVAKGPVPYLYQVKTEGEVFFTTTDGKLMFVGDLIDLKANKTNYTEKAKASGRYTILKSMNPKDTINFDPVNPQYTITVFTDTDCGYCRKFHDQIKEMNALGIAVHYAAFPRAGLQSKTFETMESIWCSKDRAAALTSAKHGQEVPKVTCATHDIPQQYHLGQKMGIRGTPALILQDGTLVPGYMPPQELKKMLDQHFGSKPA